jgi:galactokinase
MRSSQDPYAVCTVRDLTGCGFGGSIVALTEHSRAIAAGNTITNQQKRRFPSQARVLVSAAQFLDTSPE